MASKHPAFHEPSSPDIRIWRYLSFPKFVSMLEKETLFFARPDTFDDRFEGCFSNTPVVIDRAAMEAAGETDRELFKGKLIQSWSSFGATGHSYLYFNCWYMNEIENDGMWRLYGGQSQNVCVQSTYNRLWESTPGDVYVGTVKYIDYEKEDLLPFNLFNLYLHKRTSFDHEREIRAAIMSSEPTCLGIHKTVDLERLIEAIYLPPGCKPWFSELVGAITARYGLNVPILPSALDAARIPHPNYVFSDDW